METAGEFTNLSLGITTSAGFLELGSRFRSTVAGHFRVKTNRKDRSRLHRSDSGNSVNSKELERILIVCNSQK
jgi:hypothetical protein